MYEILLSKSLGHRSAPSNGRMNAHSSSSIRERPTRPAPRTLIAIDKHKCQAATEVTVVQQPETRPKTVTHLPESQCPA